jgi:outer membrane biosynthesis protein TonB
MLRITIAILLVSFLSFACASTQTEEPVEEPVAEAPPPPPAPVREPEPEAQPVAAPAPAPVLPKTAGPLPAVGLAGVSALGLAGALRLLRRRI